ncbi:MAG: PAS domain S-box protein [Gammaproteobacteria bacterium]|nr:PAS domain S-box protein [Gammaproteobacteria bacterium]
MRNLNIEQKLKNILDTVIDGIITIDTAGSICSVNRAAERMFGYSAQEMIGNNVNMLMPEPYRSGHDQYLKNYLNTGHAQIIGSGREVVGRRKDHSTFPMDLAVSKMEVDGVVMFNGVVRDITERHLAMEEVKRFKYTLDNTLDMIFMFDAETLKFIYLNRGAEQTMGYSREEMLKLTPYDIKPYISEKEFRELIKPLLNASQDTLHFETVHRKKNGTEFPVEIFLQLIRDDSGSGRFVAFVRDDTEHRAAMTQLNLQSAALEAAANAIVITDKSGIISWVNSSFLSMTGYGAEEVIGKNPKLLKSGRQSPEYYDDLWKTIRSGRVWQGELINCRKDGSLYTEEQTITPVKDSAGMVTHFIAIKQDISERRMAEQALADKNSEIKASALYERSLGQIMALLSSSFKVDEVIKQILPILAEHHDFTVSAVYLLDETGTAFKAVTSYGVPESFTAKIGLGEGLIGQVAEQRKTIEITASIDMPFKIDSGLFSITPAAVLAAPIIFANMLLGVIVIASAHSFKRRDISFVERLTDHIGVSLNNGMHYHNLKMLSEQLRQRGQEITEKNKQLQRASRLKTEFLANMSHELRTPLNAIIGFSEVLKDGLLGDLNAQQQDYTLEVFNSAHHLLSLINDILDLSKIEAGKMDLYLEPVNIHELISNALSIVKEKAYANSIEIKLNIAAEVTQTIQADGRKLKQVIYNLLSNAVKFSETGGQVLIDVTQHNQQLKVCVSDTGIGISKQQQAELFTPFQQVDGSISRKYEGTGLGLVMVKRLVELHQGKVSVESCAGVGSQFCFTLPVTETLLDEQAESSVSITQEMAIVNQRFDELRASTSDSLAEKKIVLMVEDNQSAADLMTQQLSSVKCQVLHALTGSEGLRLAAQHKPDLMILDILLPDIDGWEVMRQMKQDQQLAHIPVMVVSIVADRNRGMELGAVDVLEKPVNKMQLLQTVQRVIHQYSPDAGKTILVVDDDLNAVNSLTIELQENGYQVLNAGCGEDALLSALRHKPELILLDLMMPGVTGIEVINSLHSEEQTRDIPVVILTDRILTKEDRALLNNRVLKIVEKSQFDAQSFLRDIQHLLNSTAIASDPLWKPEAEKARKRVLVVGEDQQQANLLQLYLGDAGYSVKQAMNSHEALSFLTIERPVLITLDSASMVENGNLFLQEKAKHIEYDAIPVVALVTREEMDSAALWGDAVIIKPVKQSRLLKVVDDFVNISRGVS